MTFLCGKCGDVFATKSQLAAHVSVQPRYCSEWVSSLEDELAELERTDRDVARAAKRLHEVTERITARRVSGADGGATVTPEQAYEATADALVKRILSTFEQHPEAANLTSAWDLFKVPGFDCSDIGPSAAQAGWAFGRAKALWKAQK